MTAPPLIAVVPPALVARLPAVTAAVSVVVPVELSARASRAAVPPTAPVKVMAPVPALTVRSRAPPVESTVEENSTVLSVVVSVVSAPSVTAPL